MKPPAFSSLLRIGLILLPAGKFSGCSDSHADSIDDQSHAPAACTYREGRGVLLTAAAREFAGLTTAAVSAQEDIGTTVPRDAVLETAVGPVVYVANGDWFLRTPVELGRNLSANHVEITEGLYEGDVVAVGGLRVLALAEIQAVNGGVGCADGH